MKNNLIKTEMDVKGSKIGIMRVGNIGTYAQLDISFGFAS